MQSSSFEENASYNPIGLVAPWIEKPKKKVLWDKDCPPWIFNLYSIANLYGACTVFEVFEKYENKKLNYEKKANNFLIKFLKKIKLIKLQKPQLLDFAKQNCFYKKTRLWLIRSILEILEYSPSFQKAINNVEKLIKAVEELTWGDSEGKERIIALLSLKELLKKVDIYTLISLVKGKKINSLASLLEVNPQEITLVFKYWGL